LSNLPSIVVGFLETNLDKLFGKSNIVDCEMKRKETYNQQRKRLRAGRFRCRRCKVLFASAKGDTSHLCQHCRMHCRRCDVELTTENRLQSKRAYLCKTCHTKTNLYTNSDKNRERNLLKKYGITLDEYERILRDQNGACWICHQPPKNRRLHVDHKHVTKDKQQNPRDTRTRVRGLLCWFCNAALAKFKDNSIHMQRAAEYVTACPAQKVLKGE
jgi:hypothetical protein